MAIRNILERCFPWYQIYTIFTLSLGGFTLSTFLGWPSPSIPILISNSSHIPGITLEDASYFSVIPPISTVLVTPLISALVDIIGRKKIIMFMSIPYCLAWILIITANNLTFLYISRMLSGISDGMFVIVTVMYMAEIATPNVRGTWGNLVVIALYIAQFLINIVGSYFDIVTTGFIMICVPIVQFILAAFIPESPYYLLMKNKTEEAEKSLKLLRRRNDVQEELMSISHDVKRQISESGTLKELFTIPINRKPLLICVTIRVSQQFSGLSAFIVYSQYIFSLAGGSLSGSSCAIIYTGLTAVVCILYSFVVNKFGRRYMLIFSCIGCTIALFIEAIYFYLKFETSTNLSNVDWIPLAGMILYVIANASGLAIIPYLISGELFAANVKGKACGILNIILSLSVLFTPKLFQALTASYSMYLPFLVFGVCTFLSIGFCYFFVPETKGKTLEEIQQMMIKNVIK